MFGLWWQALPPGEGQQAGDSDRKPQTAFQQLRAGNRKGVGAGASLGGGKGKLLWRTPRGEVFMCFKNNNRPSWGGGTCM